MSLTDYLDRVRREQGLLTIDEVIALAERGNVIYDPITALISANAVIGARNIFFPGVYLLCRPEGGILAIGDGNVFHANSLFEAVMGEIRVGDANQFGEGGFTAKANRPGASIIMGSGGRYLNGASVYGKSRLGSGSQLLGAITADSCVLEAGGGYQEPDPDRRGGLLKGHGVARNLTVPTGHVIVGSGVFVAEALQPQADFHPKAR